MLSLRPFQKHALQALTYPGHVVCVAPTGSGKSLIYEQAARRWARKSILITPLLALGRQQRERLAGASAGEVLGTPESSSRALQVRACLSSEPRERRFPPDPAAGESGIWIVSPESLQVPAWRAALQGYCPDLWIVDEAHCIWEWGRGFRPAYAEILPRFSELARARGGTLRSLWLTATLLPEHRTALLTSLAAAGGAVSEVGGFEVPTAMELFFERVPHAQRIARLLVWLRCLQGSGIVFVSSRMSAARVGKLLCAAGYPAHVYHSGLIPEERARLESAFRSPGRKIIVATSAFGMGMDLSDLRWSLLWEPPFTPIDLAQRLGRVGRGYAANPSASALPRGIVFWDHPDALAQHSIGGEPRPWLKLLGAQRCRRTILSGFFEVNVAEPPLQKRLSEHCGRCNHCFSETQISSQI